MTLSCGRGVTALLCAALAAGPVGAAACRRSRPAAGRTRPTLRIATAFAPLSQPLTTEYQRRLQDLDVRPAPAADSEAVIEGIEHDAVDVGVSLADVAYRAYAAAGGDGSTSASRVRGVSLLQPLPQYVVVRAHSGIHSIGDLRARRVALGPENSSSARLGALVLDAFGVEPSAVTHLSTRAEAAQRLKDGSLDAAFFPGYVYPDELTYSAIRGGAYLIPIDGPPVDRLRREHPFVRSATIPRGIYPGQDRIIPTVGIDMVVLCRRDLDSTIVYELTAQLFRAYPQIASVEATLRFLNPDEAPATPIPLHAGAARYFRERELSR